MPSRVMAFVYENSPFKTSPVFNSKSFDQNFMKNGHMV